MMDAAPTFPLYRLPTKVIIHFLRILHFHEMIAIASLSQKLKSLCQTANHKGSIRGVAISSFVHIVVARSHNLTYFMFHYDPEDSQLTMPTRIEVGSLVGGGKLEWRSLLDIGLILEFSNRRSFQLLRFTEGCEQLDLGAIKQTLSPFEKLIISEDVNNEYSKRILAELTPDAKSLVCRRNPYQNLEDFQKILIQNLEKFEGTWSLNSLLACNSSWICNSSIIRTNLSDKDINRFLKLWKKGSNGNLKTMSFTVRQDLDTQEILRGLRYKEFPEEQRRIIEKECPEDNVKVFGGFDICRADGTKGTILIDDGDLVFHVWR